MEINIETIFATISTCFFIVGLVFVSIGIYANQRKIPMYFYAGSEIDSSKIIDVKAYNRANGIMWVCYGVLYFIPMVIYFLFPALMSDSVLSICAVICFLGLLALLWLYQKIEDKYLIE